MAQQLSAFGGSAIYLDTMLPFMLLRGVGESTLHFFERLERGEFTAYTSVLTFDELAYRLLLAFIRDHFEGSPIDRLRDAEDQMLRAFAPGVARLLSRFQLYRSLIILDARVSDLQALNTGMTTYGLRPRDALHFAAMQRVECLNIASNDHHFDRVPAIERFASDS